VAIRITDPVPYRDTGKTCLGGGMQCPSASSCVCIFYCFQVTRITNCLWKEEGVTWPISCGLDGNLCIGWHLAWSVCVANLK